MDYDKMYKETLKSLQRLVSKGEITETIAKAICPEFVAESEDEKIKKDLIRIVSDWKEGHYTWNPNIEYCDRVLAWLERQGEQKPVEMIQWKGDNLKKVIAFVGKCNRFDKWFKTWGEYEKYVHEHNSILKLFNEDGSHYEVPVDAWIVKTPDGHNVPTTFTFVQKPVKWSKEDDGHLEYLNYLIKNHATKEYAKKINSWLQLLKERAQLQPKKECSEEDKSVLSSAEVWLDTLCDYLRDSSPNEVGEVKNIIFKLKSLRPQSHWKPTEEQVEVLESATANCAYSEYQDCLEDLIKQLKAL